MGAISFNLQSINHNNMKKLVIIILTLICISGCTSYDYPEKIPEDFYISLTWECYGCRSYNSETGQLSDCEHDTCYQLTNEDKAYFYDLITSMDIFSYPDTYDPNPGVICHPPTTLILKVRINGDSKEIRAENISDYASSIPLIGRKGQKFLSTCDSIAFRLMRTQEWKDLPESKYQYE